MSIQGISPDNGSSFLHNFIQDYYKDGVERSTDKKLVFINPDQLRDPDIDTNVETLRQMLEKQHPGITEDASDTEIKQVLAFATHAGPFALHAEEYCIINRPGTEFDEAEELVPALAGHDMEELTQVPGYSELWQHLIGIHEGLHCDAAPKTLGSSREDRARSALAWEAEADQRVMKFLRETGQNDIAQTWKDYRALTAGDGDPSHDTSIFLADHTPVDVTQDHINASKTFRDKMGYAVEDALIEDDPELKKMFAENPLAALDIAQDRAEDLFEENPRAYFDIVDNAVAEGRFSSEPHVQSYIEDFSGAYHRQILDMNRPPPQGGEYKHATPPRDTPATSQEADPDIEDEMTEENYQPAADDYDFSDMVGHETPATEAPIQNPQENTPVPGTAQPSQTAAPGMN